MTFPVWYHRRVGSACKCSSAKMQERISFPLLRLSASLEKKDYPPVSWPPLASLALWLDIARMLVFLVSSSTLMFRTHGCRTASVPSIPPSKSKACTTILFFRMVVFLSYFLISLHILIISTFEGVMKNGQAKGREKSI